MKFIFSKLEIFRFFKIREQPIIKLAKEITKWGENQAPIERQCALDGGAVVEYNHLGDARTKQRRAHDAGRASAFLQPQKQVNVRDRHRRSRHEK